MNETIEVTGVVFVVAAFVLFVVAASVVGWWLAVAVGGAEAFLSGVLLVAVAAKRDAVKPAEATT